MTAMNMAKKKSPAKNDGTPTKQSCEKKSPAKNDGMPAKQYCPQESKMPNKNKLKLTHLNENYCNLNYSVLLLAHLLQPTKKKLKLIAGAVGGGGGGGDAHHK